jgi:hypothetical protein
MQRSRSGPIGRKSSGTAITTDALPPERATAARRVSRPGRFVSVEYGLPLEKLCIKTCTYDGGQMTGSRRRCDSPLRGIRGIATSRAVLSSETGALCWTGSFCGRSDIGTRVRPFDVNYQSYTHIRTVLLYCIWFNSLLVTITLTNVNVDGQSSKALILFLW